MIERLVSLAMPPGFFNTGTTFQARGRWHAGSLVRFFQGTIQPIGGWVQRTLTGATISGTPNAAISWQTNDGVSYLAIGTTSGLYVVTAGGTVYDITPITGVSAAPFTWQLETFGSYLIACIRAPQSLAAGPSSPIFDGITYFAWTGNVASRAAVPQTATTLSSSLTAPTAPYGLAVTPERFLVLLRGSDPVSLSAPPGDVVDGGSVAVPFPNYSVRRVYWATQETITDWISTATNTAGSFDLATDGVLVTGKAVSGRTLIWSTTDLWTMTFIGGEFVYSFLRVGNNCGIISGRAAVVLDTGAYWMGVNKFFCFDGFVKPIACEVQDYVFGNFNASRSSLVWALANPQFGEIIWFYPSAIATSCDRYVTYNYQENHWAFGVLQRSAGVTMQAGSTSGVPVMIDASGHIYDHETGTGRGTLGSAYAESGPMQMDEGDNVMRIQRIVPDDKTAGDVVASLYTAMYPDAVETLNGPYALASPTSVRVTARQVRLVITEAVASAWRLGTVRLGAIVSGRR